MPDFLSLETLASLPGPPESTGQTSNWHGHIPLARWLLREARPSTFVELGVWRGDSYFAFCEAVRNVGLPTKCFGIDSWEGDEQAGLLAGETYDRLSAYHDPQYGSFSKLMRMRFDAALPSFADGSIDLLHIDGLHTYEAVKHDFETWLPKVSERGVVLFHDTAVTTSDFGVHRLWREISGRYPSFTFFNSYGLGVLAVGSEPPEAVRWLTSLPNEQQDEFRKLFQHLGAAIVAQWHLPSGPSGEYSFDPKNSDPLELERRARALDLWGKDSASLHDFEKLRARIESVPHEMESLRHELAAIRSSTSWKATAPLRRLLDLLRGRK